MCIIRLVFPFLLVGEKRAHSFRAVGNYNLAAAVLTLFCLYSLSDFSHTHLLVAASHTICATNTSYTAWYTPRGLNFGKIQS